MESHDEFEMEKAPKMKLGWDVIGLLTFAIILVAIPVVLIMSDAGSSDTQPTIAQSSETK